jgi:hypothetical protein
MTSPFSFTAKTDLVDDHLAAHVNALQLAADVLAKSPNGTLFNGKLSVTVASSNITVAIKTLDGNDPSSSDPVYIVINSVVYPLTDALSVTKNAGTNWFNSGGTNLATFEIDYFVYIIWNTTPVPDVLDIGFARIPYGRIYSDFSGTTTNGRYLAYGNGSAPNGSNDVVLVGRFAATLSAAAAHNWSVPSFTQINLIQRPIYETRRLTWSPTPTGYSALPTNTYYEYIFDNNMCTVMISEATNGTSNATTVGMTAPIAPATVTNAIWTGNGSGFDNGAELTTPVRIQVSSGAGGISLFPNHSAASAWTNVNGKRISTARLQFPIA